MKNLLKTKKTIDFFEKFDSEISKKPICKFKFEQISLQI